jgi:hypothetical protein
MPVLERQLAGDVVALWAARSSMTSSRFERVALSSTPLP